MEVTNSHNLPSPIVEAAKSNYTYRERRISVTELLKGTAEIVLTRRHYQEMSIDASDCVFQIFGSAVHKVLEEQNPTEYQHQEMHLETDINGWTVSGYIDLFDEETRTVTDYKTASIWKVKMNDWADYEQQLKLYAWLLFRNGYKVDTVQIVALLKDHSKSKAAYDREYPQNPIYRISWGISWGDLIEARQFVEQKLAEIDIAQKLSDDALIPCKPDERWSRGECWAVMKKGRKTSLKNCESETEAKEYIKNHEQSGLFIEHRPGVDSKCENYCNVADWCPYRREK